MCLVFLFVSFFVSPHLAVCLGLAQQTFGLSLLLSVIDYEYGVCYRCVALVTAFYFVSLCSCVVVFVLVLVLFSVPAFGIASRECMYFVCLFFLFFVSPHSALRLGFACGSICVCSSRSLYRRIRHSVLWLIGFHFFGVGIVLSCSHSLSCLPLLVYPFFYSPQKHCIRLCALGFQQLFWYQIWY